MADAAESPSTPERWWRKPWVLGAVGAAVALTIIVSVRPSLERRTAGPPGAGVPPVTITRPSTAAPFDRVFAWRPVDGATTYQVVVFSAAGERSFEVRDLKSTGVKLAESLALPPGQYFVQVTAFRETEVVAESARTPFDVK